MRVLLAVVLISISTAVSAQSDPYYKATYRWLSFAATRKWDSALQTARQLKTLVKNEYGDTSLQYSVALAGILGQTWFAEKKTDSAIACYQAAMDQLRQ